MVIAVSPQDAEKATKAAKAAGEQVYTIGEIRSGEKGVVLC